MMKRSQAQQVIDLALVGMQTRERNLIDVVKLGDQRDRDMEADLLRESWDALMEFHQLCLDNFDWDLSVK